MSGIFFRHRIRICGHYFSNDKNSDFSQYTIAGMKTLAILFFLINILKKYNEGVANNEGYTWGLTPAELAKKLCNSDFGHFSTQVLGVFDTILVAIENQYRDTAPALLPLQMQDIDIEQDVSAWDAAKKAMAMLYEALVTPLYGLKILSFIAGIFLWLLDLFIYPLFLAERFFLLGIMQAFFHWSSVWLFLKNLGRWHTIFFKLYAGVYMLVPAFFLVNVFVNNLYTEINTNFWSDLFGTDWGSNFSHRFYS